MVNIVCEQGFIKKQDNFMISNVIYPKRVAFMDEVKITIEVECLNTYFAGDVRVCLYSNNEFIDSSAQTRLNPWDKKKFNFTFLMPSNDMLVDVILLGTNIYTFDQEDYKQLLIRALPEGDESEPPTDDDGNIVEDYLIYMIIAGAVLAGIILIGVLKK